MTYFSGRKSYGKFYAQIFVSVLFLTFSRSICIAQVGISVMGAWATVLPVASVTEAGEDFHGTYESDPDQVLIDILGANKFDYRVDVRKIDIDWHPSLQLYIHRTGSGIGGHPHSNVTGGTNYFELTATNQQFFSGHRESSDIPVQFRLTGVSVLIPARTHVSTVMYTVIEE